MMLTSSKILRSTLALAVGLSMFCGELGAVPIPPPRASEIVYPHRIRVRLAEAEGGIRLRGFDLRIFETAGRKLASAPDRISEWRMQCDGGKVQAVSLVDRKTLTLSEPVVIRSPAGFIRVNGRPYRDEIRLHSVKGGCEAVNDVDLEKYLHGLVNAEFSSKWSEEAVGAQVVAARTYAFHQILMARGDVNRNYDVDATVKDQVYDGSMKEDFRASRSVERTRGMVLTAGTGSKPLKAFYHSTCGGQTELPENVWGGPFAGFKRSVRCPYCSGSPALNWSLEVSTQEMAEKFWSASKSGAKLPSGAISWPSGWKTVLQAKKLVDLRPRKLDAQGRVIEVSSVWRLPSGQNVELGLRAARLREWLGAARFKSTQFAVIPSAVGSDTISRWRFQGRGNGHGVGMCQWGAKTMGEKGFSTAAILKHYYPDATLRKLW